LATGKRYYWIKLKETFMTSDTVDFLMGQPNGAQYVVLYQMLCLMTANTNGKLSRQIGDVIIPYDPEKIQRDTKWFSVDTVRVALGLYAKLGLVYQDQDGTLVLTNHSELVGSETDFSAQKRRQRSIQREISSGDCGQCPQQCPQDVHKNVHTDIRDKEIDIRYKEISPNGDTKKGAKAPSPTLKSTRFHPPDMESVSEYFAQKGGTNAQAERFFAYYESNGWRVGKNPMKKWKAAASGWIARDAEQAVGRNRAATKSAAEAYANIFKGVKP
jgi:hypothetical protein